MLKVLVIEDNKDNLRLAEYALQRAGYEVITAETGEAGVELALAEKPFFIIMDIGLPGIDGVEATRRIRNSEVGQDVPIIAITAHAMQGDREQMMAADCSGYIEKPIDPITLLDQIHKIIGVTEK
jgi:two-component system cell cycle response regulator DivK